jgi:hypothetical protein
MVKLLPIHSMSKTKELLDKLSNRMEQLKDSGKKDSPEYKELSEEWQDIAHDIVMCEILYDEYNL